MEAKKSSPWSLKIVAALFILGGVASIIDVVIRFMHGQIFFNFAVLGLFVGIGLLRFSRFWRTCALVLLWIALIAAPSVVLGLLFLKGFGTPRSAFPWFKLEPGTSRWVVCAEMALVFAVASWKFWVLTRPDIRELFGLRAVERRRFRNAGGIGALAILAGLAVGVVVEALPVDPVHQVRELGGRVEVDENAPGKPVVYVSLEGCDVTNADIACLEKLPALRTLNLKDARMQDEAWGEGFDHLKGLADLRELNLAGTGIHAGGLKHLQELTHLRVLNLSHAPVMGQGLLYLATLPDLRELDLSDCVLDQGDSPRRTDIMALLSPMRSAPAATDQGLACVKRLVDLQTLNLARTGATDAGLKELADMKGLKELNLTSCPGVTDAGLKNLEGLVNLQSLKLAGCKVTDAGLENLQGLANLQSLDLENADVGAAGLEHLKGLAHLQKLGLSRTRLLNQGLEPLADFPGLQELDLSCGNGPVAVTNAQLEHLKGLQQLQVLNLNGSVVTDEGLKQLAGLKRLRKLNLGDTKVTGVGLKDLSKLPELRELSLERSALNEAGLEEVGKLTRLTALNLYGDDVVTDDGLKHLEGLADLETLELGDTYRTNNVTNSKVTDAGLDHLKGLVKLQRLNLAGCHVTDAGLDRLKDFVNLRSLNLEYTQVTDAGLDRLKALPNLGSLVLRDTKVTYAGLDRLKGFPKLTELDVSYTEAYNHTPEVFTALPGVRVTCAYNPSF